MPDCPPPIRELDEEVCRDCRMRWDAREDRPECPKSFRRGGAVGKIEILPNSHSPYAHMAAARPPQIVMGELDRLQMKIRHYETYLRRIADGGNIVAQEALYKGARL